jgi:hypothetical protein
MMMELRTIEGINCALGHPLRTAMLDAMRRDSLLRQAVRRAAAGNLCPAKDASCLMMILKIARCSLKIIV